jgi:hypothetical protein
MPDPPERELSNARPGSVEGLTATTRGGGVAMDTGVGTLTGGAPQEHGQGADMVAAVANGADEVNLLQSE